MANSKRKCGGCGEYFRPEQEFPGPVAWCSPDCGLIVAKKRVPAIKERKAKEARAEHRAAKERVKRRSEWVNDAQRLLNQIVVLEDGPRGCITCEPGSPNPVTDCGHYFHRGNKYRVSPLTLLRINLNGQCELCNRWEGGKQHEYREGLIARYGQEAFDELVEFKRKVDSKEIPPLTIEQCKKLIGEYKAKLKALKQGREAA